MKRFWDKTEPGPNGCINWTAALHPTGYGKFYYEGQVMGAHRAAYLMFVGPVPEGLDLDHLCRNRRCVNVEHLEPVTRGENVLRGEGPTARNARKTHCPQGHEYTPDNIYWAGTFRRCATCYRDRQRAYNRRKAAEKRAAA